MTSFCDPSCTGDHTRPRGLVYAISNAIVVTDSDDVIDAACRARRMWNDRHPATVMPEGIYDPATSCVWFPRPGHTARATRQLERCDCQ